MLISAMITARINQGTEQQKTLQRAQSKIPRMEETYVSRVKGRVEKG
jgi:hypothetical protein